MGVGKARLTSKWVQFRQQPDHRGSDSRSSTKEKIEALGECGVRGLKLEKARAVPPNGSAPCVAKVAISAAVLLQGPGISFHLPSSSLATPPPCKIPFAL